MAEEARLSRSAVPVTRVWTDGSCKRNPGPGGWGWITADGRNDSGGEDQSTNQRMEITAAAEAVRSIEGPLEIISDSTYVVSCFNKGWYKGWLDRGWTNAQKKPVANRDLWEPFIKEVLARKDVKFTWVKGHAGDRMNEKADLLAQAAAQAVHDAQVAAGIDPNASGQAGAGAGAGAVGGAGAATRVAAVAGSDSRSPAGWKIAVLGQRSLSPDQQQFLVPELARILSGYREMHPDLVVVTGLREGAEAAAAAAARSAGLPYVAVLPWPNPADRMPAEMRGRFSVDLESARETVVLERKVPADAAAKRQALKRRNGWLAANCDAAIVAHDGRDGEGLGALQAMHKLGDDVWDLELPQ